VDNLRPIAEQAFMVAAGMLTLLEGTFMASQAARVSKQNNNSSPPRCQKKLTNETHKQTKTSETTIRLLKEVYTQGKGKFWARLCRP